ncbi:aminotransferase class V-fold PLP-dependent enzyme [Candidatus Marinimicrobia bacterium]|nr:aminotransferase class V-fold PLP-dependent enzyme [Candidatus Neomarinimicrobiota bacterium]
MIPLYKPYMPPELPELNNILYSGNLSYGKWGKQFEEDLGNYIGNDQILTINSYNSAMLVLLAALDIKFGDTIIASPMSCLASNQPFATQGLNIIWCDIDSSTGTLDPEQVRSLITKDVKAIFHNHFCGYVGYVDEINAIGKEYGIPIVDDAIEAFGSKYKNNMMGNLGSDCTVFSFETIRMPNCISGGGIVFKDKKLFKKAELIRDYGIERKLFRNNLGEIRKNADIDVAGFGFMPNEINSYIGLMHLKEMENLFGKIKNNANKWNIFFNDDKYDVKSLKINRFSEPNYWIYGVLATQKNSFLKSMRVKGLYTSGVHMNNNRYSIFRNKIDLKGVNKFMDQFVAIPCGWWVTKLDF